MSKHLLAGVSLGLLAISPSWAVTINFDNLAAGSTLSNQYAAQGVTFSANAFSGPGSSSSGQNWASNTDMTIVSLVTGVLGTDFGTVGSPALVNGNVLRRYVNWLNVENGDASFSINFSTPVRSVSLDFASVAGINAAPDTRLFIYNGNTLLGVVGGTLPTTAVGQLTLSFAAASITRVAVAPGTFNDWVAVDNLVFQPVPEPGRYGMMALGLAALGLAARRRGSSVR